MTTDLFKPFSSHLNSSHWIFTKKHIQGHRPCIFSLITHKYIVLEQWRKKTIIVCMFQRFFNQELMPSLMFGSVMDHCERDTSKSACSRTAS